MNILRFSNLLSQVLQVSLEATKPRFPMYPSGKVSTNASPTLPMAG